jgi:dienelactone hydrolase/tRNA A-37 threonylcarbamoyl transferase component Bud32
MPVQCPHCHSENPEDSAFCRKCGSKLPLGGHVPFSFTKTLESVEGLAAKGSTFAGKYTILEEIGHGGMGIVYKAEDTMLKRPVALKFLPAELARHEEAKGRFIREAQAAAALDHPNICAIHEVGEADGQAYIAMAYIEGMTLRDRLALKPFDTGEAVGLAVQIAEGLDEARQKGIIHRDIKSANIMITEKGQAKIMDFGLAKVAGGPVITTEVKTMGTVAYMSPEQARGEAVDHRTDIWSLGVVLYEMLTGRLPFHGERETSILYSIVHEEPKPIRQINADIPVEVQRIIDRALKKNKSERYASAAEMAKELRACRDFLKTGEAETFTLRSVGHWLRRPKVAIPLAAALATIAFLAFWLIGRQAKIRWARGALLPQIEQLIMAEGSGRDNLIDAYKLVQKAEKYIRRDPELAELASKCAVNISIETVPADARISIKKYSAPDSEWEYLGDSPLNNIRLPMGIFRWKIEKEGYETVQAAAFAYKRDESRPYFNIPYDLRWALDKKGSLPPGMVRVAGGQVQDIGPIDDFFIDQFEVTNRQFKEFVDQGGYQKKEYWKNPFVRDGKTMTWEEAMALFVDQTGRPGPSTWQAGAFPLGHEDYPVSGVSWYEAAAYAEFAGKSLPTSCHWDIARGELTPLYQSGFLSIFYPLCNFQGEGPTQVGKYQGIAAYGTYDMAGNVREWCWNETPHGRLVRGGAWNDINYMFYELSQAPAFDRSAKNGFRCARYLDPKKIAEAALAPIRFAGIAEQGNLYELKPVPDSVFQVYKDQFSYDKRDLNARVESTDEKARDWTKQKITFDTANADERMTAYLFLPKNSRPPFQTVIYFPGSSAVEQKSSQDLEKYVWFEVDLSFLLQDGRAVLFPIYAGTFERKDPRIPEIIPPDTRLYTDYYIRVIKEFKRSIDYLESRRDIDSGKLAYLGFSWGGWLGTMVPAVEERLKVSIIKAGGLRNRGRPEMNSVNYVTRVKLPTLMLNGKYDMDFPYETSAKPMYDLLGTPKEDKVQKLYDTDHFIPHNEFIKETLAWLDKYFGRPAR